MKKIILVAFLSFISNLVLAQDTWKERTEFYEMLNASILSAKEGNTDAVVAKHTVFTEKFRAFISSCNEKLDKLDKDFKKDKTLFSEQFTLIGIIIKSNKFNAETMYGNLVTLLNRFLELKLKDEDPIISKDLMKFYKKEEARYLKKKKSIYALNGWH
jgi:hypothetical protein